MTVSLNTPMYSLAIQVSVFQDCVPSCIRERNMHRWNLDQRFAHLQSLVASDGSCGSAAVLRGQPAQLIARSPIFSWDGQVTWPRWPVFPHHTAVEYLDMSLESGQSLSALSHHPALQKQQIVQHQRHGQIGSLWQGQWVDTRSPQIYYHQCIAHCAPLSGSRIQQTGHNYATTIVYTCLLPTAVIYTKPQRWSFLF